MKKIYVELSNLRNWNFSKAGLGLIFYLNKGMKV